MTWQKGRAIVTANRIEEEGPLQRFVDAVRDAASRRSQRVPGTAVFLNANRETTPLALRANVEHNHVLHECVADRLGRARSGCPTSRTPSGSRSTTSATSDDGITHITACFGFQDDPNVPRAAARGGRARRRGAAGPPACTYFLSRITIMRTDSPGMRPWRKRLFTAMARNAADPVAWFGLPFDDTITVGSHVEL